MATSYANTGGTGDRTAIITVTASASLIASGAVSNLVNGNTAENNTWFNARTDGKITFDFGSGNLKIIDTFKWYQSNNSNHGTWKWEGSNDGSSYSDVGSSFTFDGGIAGAAKEFTAPLSGNTLAYRYWRLTQVSGTCNTGPFIREMEFKLEAGAAATQRGRAVIVG